MRKIALISVCLVITLLMSSCSLNNSLVAQGSSSDNQGTAANQSTTNNEQVEASSFMPIGKKVKIWLLRHRGSQSYSVGLRTPNKTLVWENITASSVFIEDDIETSYLERIEDGTDLFGNAAKYNIHIKVSEANSTVTTPNPQDPNDHSDIESDMIIGGGSW